MRRLPRALAAAVALLVLLVGVPALLAATVGNPVTGWGGLIAGDLSDTVVIDVLAAVACLAWAQFAVAVILEVLTALTRLRLPARLPGVFPSQQQLAHSLVAAVFLLAPTAGPLTAGHILPSTHVASAVATAPATPAPPAAANRAQTADPVTTMSYVIGSDGPGTYWDLAQEFLGSGLAWKQIWALNEGRHQGDGTVMSNPGLLRPGWTVLLPTTHTVTGTASAGDDPAAAVTVRAGDTLSGIAATHEVADWHRLWNANLGRTQPDGKRLTDPDHIEPGWVIALPHDPPATAPAPSVAAPAPAPDVQTMPPPPSVVSVSPSAAATPAVTSPAPATRSPSVPASATSSGALTPTQAPTPSAAASPTTAPATPANPVSSPSASAASSPASTSARHLDHLDADHVEGPGLGELARVAMGAGAGLLAGVSALALARARRRQFRHRRPGRSVAPTPTALLGMDRALRTAGSSDVHWFTEALGGLAAQTAAVPDTVLPDVAAACLSDDGLELVLATPHTSPPGAWTTDTTGTRWRQDRLAPTGCDPGRRNYQFSPYPTLVSVGHTPNGQHWMVDLERAGTVRLTGERTACLDLARFIAAELAHSTWSDHMWLTLAGFGSDLAGLNDGRVTVVDNKDTAVIADVARRLRENAESVDSTGIDILRARLRDLLDPEVFPTILIIDPDQPPSTELTELLDALPARPGRTSVAVVTTAITDRTGSSPDADPAAGLTLHLARDGQLVISSLGLTLTPHALPAERAANLATLIGGAATDRLLDVPTPDARGHTPWDAFADVHAGLRVDVVRADRHHTGPADLPSLRPPEDTRSHSVLPLPAEIYLEHAATTTEDIDALAPQISPALRRQIEDADPTLDTDLAAWHDPDNARARLRVLGPVTVEASGSLPDERPRRAWNTEVVACLAAHPDGMTAEQLGTALWPNDPDIASKTKLRQAVSVARAWLATNPTTGQPHIPAALSPGEGHGVYRVEGLLVDADLFRRLRLRGVARGAAGISDLQAALDLVTGIPFDRQRPGGYSWLADTPLDLEYTSMIVDVAHTAATRYLGARRPDLAEAAARTALLTGGSDDVALLDLAAACDQLGRTAEAEALRRRVHDNYDDDLPEDLPPRSAQILGRRELGKGAPAATGEDGTSGR